MKILAINGSRRKNGNTSCLIQSILAPCKEAGAQIESISLGGYDIGGCIGCEGCRNYWDCIIKDDFSQIIERVDGADGIALASPTDWYSVTSDRNRFIDRCYSLIQFPINRKEWIGKYQGAGKTCITAASCEQSEESAMGNTLSLLTDFYKDIGMDVADSVKALGLFESGSIKVDKNLLQQAGSTGQNFIAHLNH